MGETVIPALATGGTAARAIRRLMEVGDASRRSYARRLGLGRSDYLALSYIYCEGPIQPRDLGSRLGLGSGTLTPLLDRLEQRGYAARTNHPADRRRLLIVMTPAGKAVMDDAFAEFDGIVDAALDEIGAGVGLAEFARLLEQLSGALALRTGPIGSPDTSAAAAQGA
ncbi:DNA-binding MarR family transcriptional regulator [Sinomonas sp. RB5]